MADDKSLGIKRFLFPATVTPFIRLRALGWFLELSPA